MHESSIADIKAPVIKSGTAITAAIGANTGLAGNAAASVAKSLALSSHNPDLFWFMMSLPWGQIASMVAALYTLALLAEWLWKKPLRALLVLLKIRSPVKRYTKEEWCKLPEEDRE